MNGNQESNEKMEQAEEAKTEELKGNRGWKRKHQNEEEKGNSKMTRFDLMYVLFFAKLFDRIKDPLIIISKVQVFMELRSQFNYVC